MAKTKKQERIRKIEEEIRLTKENIALLRKARKNCNCGAEDKPHYHVMLHYDSESGDAYSETSKQEHMRFIARLNRDVVRLRKGLSKLVVPKGRSENQNN